MTHFPADPLTLRLLAACKAMLDARKGDDDEAKKRATALCEAAIEAALKEGW